jgi:hypothetical protein
MLDEEVVEMLEVPQVVQGSLRANEILRFPAPFAFMWFPHQVPIKALTTSATNKNLKLNLLLQYFLKCLKTEASIFQ